MTSAPAEQSAETLAGGNPQSQWAQRGAGKGGQREEDQGEGLGSGGVSL